MKIVVAGPRDFKNHQAVYEVLTPLVKKWDVVIQGGASGVDSIAKRWARTYHVACRTFKAEWEHLGKQAGPSRNRQMAQEGDVLIAFWDGASPSTGNMIREMQKLGKQIMYVRLDNVEAEEAAARHYQFASEEAVPLKHTKSGKDV